MVLSPIVPQAWIRTTQCAHGLLDMDTLKVPVVVNSDLGLLVNGDLLVLWVSVSVTSKT